jgi:hypothetical protein
MSSFRSLDDKMICTAKESDMDIATVGDTVDFGTRVVALRATGHSVKNSASLLVRPDFHI